MKLRKIFLFTMICLMYCFTVVSYAQNKASNWTYIEVDNEKSKWGDYDEPVWLRYFGLDMGDLNNDGLKDIVTGQNVYLNSNGKIMDQWRKVDLGSNVDGILIIDVDGDEYGDIIAQALPNIYWLESTNEEGTEWKSIKIGEVPATSHTNSQGFEKIQLVSGGKNEFVIASNGCIYSFEIPQKPEKGDWKKTDC
jgi:hypothetical protein